METELTNLPTDIVELKLPIKTGSQEDYNELKNKNALISNVIYVCTDTGNLYLGKIRLARDPEGRLVESVGVDLLDNECILKIKYNDSDIIDILDFKKTILGSAYNSVTWDSATHELTLSPINGEPVVIDMTSVVGITSKNTNTINMVIEKHNDDETGNIISANVNIANTSDNLIQTADNGLYVGVEAVLGKF